MIIEDKVFSLKIEMNPNKEWFAGVPYQNSDLTRFQIGYSSNADGRAEYQASSSLTIRDTGNVGIGTTGPTTRLHIKAPTTTALTIEGATGNSKNIFFSKDSNVNEAKIREHAGTLGFFTGGDMTDANVFITSESGNVGIGTTAPFTKLHSSGLGTAPDLSSTVPTNASAMFSNSDTAYGTMFATAGNGNGYIQQRRTNTATYYDLLLQPHGGDVGIGTTSPSFKLDVIGTGSSGGFRTNGLWTDTNAITYWGAGPSATAYGIMTWSTGYASIYGNSGNMLKLGSHGTQGVMVVSSSKVGIGTSTPEVALHVGSAALTSNYDTNATTFAISDITNGAQMILRGKSPKLVFDITANGTGSIFLDSSHLNILSGHPVTPGSSRLYIKDDGKVGIGTNSPLGLLQLDDYTEADEGSNTTHGVASIFTDSGDDALYLGIKNHAYPNRGYGFKTTTNGVNADFTIFEKGLNGDRFTITTGGNVGIGTT